MDLYQNFNDRYHFYMHTYEKSENAEEFVTEKLSFLEFLNLSPIQNARAEEMFRDAFPEIDRELKNICPGRVINAAPLISKWVDLETRMRGLFTDEQLEKYERKHSETRVFKIHGFKWLFIDSFALNLYMDTFACA